MANEVVEGLKKARELVSKGWCRMASAMNADGETVPATSTEACKFCAFGAMYNAGYERVNFDVLLATFRSASGISHTANWNDAPGRTQAEVVAAFDAAIALAEKEAADGPR